MKARVASGSSSPAERGRSVHPKSPTRRADKASELLTDNYFIFECFIDCRKYDVFLLSNLMIRYIERLHFP
jgi:hypothetical protein